MRALENCLVCRMRSEGAGGIDKSSPVVGTGLAGRRGDFEILDCVLTDGISDPSTSSG